MPDPVPICCALADLPGTAWHALWPNGLDGFEIAVA